MFYANNKIICTSDFTILSNGMSVRIYLLIIIIDLEVRLHQYECNLFHLNVWSSVCLAKWRQYSRSFRYEERVPRLGLILTELRQKQLKILTGFKNKNSQIISYFSTTYSRRKKSYFRTIYVQSSGKPHEVIFYLLEIIRLDSRYTFRMF